MQVKTIRAIARAYNAGLQDGKAAVHAERNEQQAYEKPRWQVAFEKEGYVTARTISLRHSLAKAEAERDAAKKELAEEQAKSKSLYENQQGIADTNKRVCERLLAVEAERDYALARIATLEQQLTDAASRINELEAGGVVTALAHTRKKYEAPEYKPLPEGCEIGEGYYQLAVGETVQKGDEFWSQRKDGWYVTDLAGILVPIDLIYRRKQ